MAVVHSLDCTATLWDAAGRQIGGRPAPPGTCGPVSNNDRGASGMADLGGGEALVTFADGRACRLRTGPSGPVWRGCDAVTAGHPSYRRVRSPALASDGRVLFAGGGHGVRRPGDS